MDKLKPCPFCGGNNLSQGSILMTANYIECFDCGAYGPDSDSGDWNTRATDTALAAAEAMIAELKAEYTATIEASVRQAKTITDQQKRIAALEKALEPFAREAADWSQLGEDSDIPMICGPGNPDELSDAVFNVGDLRRAAALLKEKE